MLRLPVVESSWVLLTSVAGIKVMCVLGPREACRKKPLGADQASV
jgi:hypothetical protein